MIGTCYITFKKTVNYHSKMIILSCNHLYIKLARKKVKLKHVRDPQSAYCTFIDNLTFFFSDPLIISLVRKNKKLSPNATREEDQLRKHIIVAASCFDSPTNQTPN